MTTKRVLHGIVKATWLSWALALALLLAACGSVGRGENVTQSHASLFTAVTKWSSGNCQSNCNWSASAAWIGGTPPSGGDVVGIRSGDVVKLDINPPALGGLVIEGTLEFDPAVSHDLTIDSSPEGSGGGPTNGCGGSSGAGTGGSGSAACPDGSELNNIIVSDGTLRMRPASGSVKQGIKFINVDETQVVGSGMCPLKTDPGLWVMGSGKLDLAGTSKKAWTYLSGVGASKNATTVTVDDAAGWRVGDVFAIAPTTKPTGAVGDTTYAQFDVWKIGALNGNQITLAAVPPGDPELPTGTVSSCPTACLKYDHPLVNGKWKAEVLNLSRNVVLRGQPGRRAHVALMRTSLPQALSNVEIFHMGPRQRTCEADGTTYTANVKGRYGLHIHMADDASRGTVLDGLSLHDIGGHAYVPHRSHGITIKNSISYATFDDAYWWDPGTTEASNDILWDNDVAAALFTDPPYRGYVLSGFVLGTGRGNRVTNSVAVGITGNKTAAGFAWPEGTNDVWKFDRNVSHNNKVLGFFAWQNSSEAHVVADSAVYHNQAGGIEHGAYGSRYLYRNIEAFGNAGAGVFLHAISTVDVLSPQTFEGLTIDGEDLTNAGFVILTHKLAIPLTAPTLIRSSRVLRLGGTDPHALLFGYTGFAVGPGDLGGTELVDANNNPINNHREWFTLIDNDFSAVAKPYYLSGAGSGATATGILPESEILIQTARGQSAALHSVNFSATFDDYLSNTAATTWPWYWVPQIATGSMQFLTEGKAKATTASPGSALSYIKTRLGVSLSQAVTVQVTESSGLAGLVARRADSDRETYYRATLGNGNITVSRVTDGVVSQIATQPFALGVNVPARLEFLVEQAAPGATRLRARAQTPPPAGALTGTWSIDTVDTDTRMDGRPGRFGVFASSASAGSATFKDYSSSLLDTLTTNADYNARVQTFAVDGTPRVKAGIHQSTMLPNAAVLLQGSVSDDGPSVTSSWTKLSGPGSVTFTTPSSPTTSVAFDAEGTYWLRLSANDGTLTGRDDVRVVVTGNQPSGAVVESFNGAGAWPAAQWAGWSGYFVTPPSATLLSGQGRIAFTEAFDTALEYVKDYTAQDVNLVTTVSSSNNGATGGLFVRRQDSDPDTYLAASVGTLGSVWSSQDMRIWQAIDGTESILAMAPLPDAPGPTGNPCAAPCRLRFVTESQADGTINLRARTWSTPTEPSTWNLEVLGWSSRVFEGRRGRVGVVARTIGAPRNVFFDDFRAESTVARVTENFDIPDQPTWPAQWTTEGFVTPPILDVRGGKGRIAASATMGWGAALATINGYNAREVELVATVNLNLNNCRGGLIALRNDADSDTYLGATFGITPGAVDNVHIFKVIDGVTTDVGTPLTSPFTNNSLTYRIRFKVTPNASGGLDLMLRISDAAFPEPSGWTLTTLNWQDPRFGNNLAGRFGIYGSPGQSGRIGYWDDFQADFVPR